MFLYSPLSSQQGMYNFRVDKEAGHVYFPWPFYIQQDEILRIHYQSIQGFQISLEENGGTPTSFSLPPSDENDFFDIKVPYLTQISWINYSTWMGEIKNITSQTDQERENLDPRYSNSELTVDFQYIESKQDRLNNDYLLYNWAVKPEIFIFDFKDYQTQALMLKRLAFFVEKPGYRGQILSDEELQGKHGWNAHDYAAESLADFFNTAQKDQLNQWEIELRDLLINRQVILAEGDQFKPGIGAIISISRESSDQLRKIFLTHESVHGLFFTDENFRLDIENYWHQLPEDFKQAWKAFLFYYDHPYDTQWDFLVVNELAAYFLQSPLDKQEDYFRYRFEATAENHAEAAVILLPFLENNPGFFQKTAQDLEQILQKYYPLNAGNFNITE
ncbi:MAG: hypothetical protein PF447_10130 [Spirochaetaceae bacterium]|jgi:hypothetical protein|nr:hypothetical protein [Spirochaetaceae bacterium]